MKIYSNKMKKKEKIYKEYIKTMEIRNKKTPLSNRIHLKLPRTLDAQ